MEINKELLESLWTEAKGNARLRQNYDLRTSSADSSQRMLNALLPETEVSIHRHEKTAETVICVAGRPEEIIYEEVDEYVHDTTSRCTDVVRKKGFKEVSRHVLSPAEGQFGIQISAGVWHTIHVIEPSVIFEAKDGKYGEDGSETLEEFIARRASESSEVPTFSNSFGDLKKNIEYLIGMERQSGAMDVISPLYIARTLNVPLDKVESAMKEIGIY